MAAETIAAISTAPGMGGIGVVRVSGPRSTAIAEAILGKLPEARSATFSSFKNDDGNAIDQGIALYYPSPNSFTGEDVLELQGHGGPVVLDQLLRRCLSLGCRIARPGEFTERAFLNGKIDLVQAEAVADLIESATELGARLAVRSLRGALSDRVHLLTEALAQIRTHVEAMLDFPEEDLDATDLQIIRERIQSLIDQIGKLLRQARQGERIRDGFDVVIAGPPNAGKSSLLNTLSQSDTAIVTAIPGTTRDPLHVDIQVNGLPVRLCDTAGLRPTDDHVEQEGVKRAFDRISAADLILWVYDATLDYDEAQLRCLPQDRAITLIRNKIDLESPARHSKHPQYQEIEVSTLTGEGLDRLRQHMSDRAGVSGLGEGAFVARQRHLDALERAEERVCSAAHAIEDGLGLELVACDLGDAQRAMGEVTGEITPDDLLGRIFSSFCIGK